MSKDNNVYKSIFNRATSFYLVTLLLIYPIIFNNKYFDITKTKFNCFVYLSIGYLVIAIVSIAIDRIMNDGYGIARKKEKINAIANPLFWMGAFVISNIFAFALCDNKKLAFSGEKGRFMGLAIYIIIALVFLLIIQGINIGEGLCYVFSVPVIIAFTIAILQHMEIDALSLKKGINPKQYDIFVSTLGNINIFASFVVIVIGVFFGLSVFTKRLEGKIIGHYVVFLCGMVIMIANSDSAYLGMFAVLVVTFFIAYIEDRLPDFFKVIISFALGTLSIIALNKYVVVEYDKRGGFAQKFDNIKIGVAFLALSILAFVAVKIIHNKVEKRENKINKKIVVFVLIGLLFLAGVACFIFAKSKNMSIVKFNYKWGTYRGYIWSKCAETFKAAPVTNKIFGYGHECIYKVVSVPNIDEMKYVTKKVYDNAHNELLQYLITLGVAGLVSYIGLFISSVFYILKRAKGNPLAYAMALAVIGYFVQSLINLNQPITTPYFFVFMAIGIGLIRRKEETI